MNVPSESAASNGLTRPRRVVITGIGAITPLGIGKDALWCGVRRGESAVRPVTRFDASSFATRIAAEVNDFDVLDYMDARQARRLDRYAQFSLATAQLALADAAYDLAGEAPHEVGVYMGSALGGMGFAEEQHRNFIADGLHAVHPLLALAVFGAASSSNIAIAFGATGPNLTNANRCASGAIAVGEAFRLIKAGGATTVLAGGIEAPLAPLTFGSFALIRAMSTRNDDPAHASRPFDRDRDGFVMAEGAAILILEELGHALRRGARIYAEIVGYGISNDAHHMTAPLPTGRQAAHTIRAALREAGIAPEAIGYVNAHASSTVLNDRTETLAIKDALGAHAGHVPVSGTKALHGHALGATGAIEAAICALAIEQSFLPVSANLDNPAADCDLAHIRGAGLEYAADYVLSNSFGFGGINAALVFARYRAEDMPAD
ncbi:MAG: beta-ketoacyl-ACP synthase II [Thermomicrobiales bacterium]